MPDPVSEATLEARLNRLLDQVFPGPQRLRLEHQKTFVLRLGHRAVEVDGTPRDELRGRLDVKVSLSDRPLAMVELKREDEGLTSDDEKQVLSYARLSEPMPPLCVLSNSRETRILLTVTGERLNVDQADGATLQRTLDAVAGAAAADQASAVQFLLGRSPAVFRALFGELTRDELDRLTGDVGDLRFPLARGFRLHRAAADTIMSLLRANAPVVFAIGKALAGKTNVAADVCEEAGHSDAPRWVPVYVDCRGLTPGVLQRIANRLTATQKLPATPDDVRHWLFAGLARSADERPLVVLDSWPTEPSQNLAAELDELVENASAETYALVVFADESQGMELLGSRERGQPTRLGSRARVVKVKEALDDGEFAAATKQLFEAKRLAVWPGSDRDRAFRLPYTWRICATMGDGRNASLPSVTGAEQIATAGKLATFAAADLDALRRYVEAVLDANPHPNQQVRELLMGSPGWMLLAVAEGALGERRLGDLVRVGLLRIRHGPGHHAILSPQVPGVLAWVAVDVIADRLKRRLGSENVSASVDSLLAECGRLPYPELVSATAAMRLDPSAAADVLIELTGRAPASSPLRPNGRYAILLHGQPAIDVPDDVVAASLAEGPGRIYDFPLPHLAAAHMLRECDLSEQGLWELIAGCATALASVTHPVRAIDPSLVYISETLISVEVIDLPNGTSIATVNNGLVEPVTAVLERIAIEALPLFEQLVAGGQERDGPPSIPLLYRLWLAAQSAAERGTEAAETIAAVAARLYGEVGRRVAALAEDGGPTSGSGT